MGLFGAFLTIVTFHTLYKTWCSKKDGDKDDDIAHVVVSNSVWLVMPVH